MRRRESAQDVKSCRWRCRWSTLSAERDPRRYRDTYQEKVRELVKAKAEGQEIATAEAPPAATNVIDLMKVLEGSLQATRSGRSGAEPAEQKSKPAPRKTARAVAAKKAATTPTRNAPPKKAATASTRSRDRGTGGKRELQKLSKAELYRRATNQDVAGPSKMSREELRSPVTGAADVAI